MPGSTRVESGCHKNFVKLDYRPSHALQILACLNYTFASHAFQSFACASIPHACSSTCASSQGALHATCASLQNVSSIPLIPQAAFFHVPPVTRELLFRTRFCFTCILLFKMHHIPFTEPSVTLPFSFTYLPFQVHFYSTRRVGRSTCVSMLAP